MTFKNLQDEMISVPAARFKESQRASVKQWINDRYAELWGMENWTFKRAESSPTVTAGTATLLSTPSDLGKVLGLWRDDGEPIDYIAARDFNDLYLYPPFTGSPCEFKIVNGVITLGPTPSASATYTLLYEKKLTQLVNDNDVPAIPTEYHSILVDGATALGSVRMNDFTYQFAEQRWQNAVDQMRKQYLVDQRGQTLQWGADGLGVWGY